MRNIILVLTSALFTFLSCKKESGSSSGNTSRTIRNELTGNFTGILLASYATASGGTNNEQVTSLPWNKEITYASNVTAAVIAVSGNGGSAGQQVTVVVKNGGSQMSSTQVTENCSGSFSQAAPVITF